MDYALGREREEENFVRDAVSECKRQFGKVAEIKVKRDDASSSIIITAVATGRKLKITERELLSGERIRTKKAICFWIRDQR